MSPVSHPNLDELFPKFNQSIKNTQQITKLNLKAIQPTVYKISCLQAFWAAIFANCPPSVILFPMNYSQKLIRSSDIPRGPAYTISMRSIKQLKRYRAHKLLGRLWLGAKKVYIWEELPRHIVHVCKNKTNSSVNLLVRAVYIHDTPVAAAETE